MVFFKLVPRRPMSLCLLFVLFAGVIFLFVQHEQQQQQQQQQHYFSVTNDIHRHQEAAVVVPGAGPETTAPLSFTNTSHAAATASAAAGRRGLKKKDKKKKAATTTSTKTTAAATTKTTTAVTKAAPQVSFLFVIGIEGTGHHLVETLYKQSPTYRRINQDFNLTDGMVDLHQDLYPKGLWDGACHPRHDKEINVQAKYQSFVQHLQEMYNSVVAQASAAAAAANDDDDNGGGGDVDDIHILLNANDAQRGEMSYPTDSLSCRPLHYPDLDQLYMACEAASVACGHVYLYRDPYQVIRSTARRKFNKGDMLVATKLYYSMLNNIYAQLSANAHRTLGCWGFYPSLSDEQGEQESNNNQNEELWDGVRDLFGWSAKNQTAFDVVLDTTYSPPPIPTREEMENIVSDSQQIYMQSMIKAHERTLNLCRKQVRSITGKEGFS